MFFDVLMKQDEGFLVKGPTDLQESLKSLSRMFSRFSETFLGAEWRFRDDLERF